MARRIPPTDDRYVAARPLDFGDRKFAEGDPFPWQEMGMVKSQVEHRWWIGELDAAPPVLIAPELPTIAEVPVVPHVQYPEKLTRAERRAARR